MIKVINKMQYIQHTLRRWAPQFSHGYAPQIKEVRQQLETLQKGSDFDSLDCILHERSLQLQYRKLLNLEEDFWKQKCSLLVASRG